MDDLTKFNSIWPVASESVETVGTGESGDQDSSVVEVEVSLFGDDLIGEVENDMDDEDADSDADSVESIIPHYQVDAFIPKGNFTDEGEVSDSESPSYVHMPVGDAAEHFDPAVVSISDIEKTGVVFSESKEHVLMPMASNPDGPTTGGNSDGEVSDASISKSPEEFESALYRFERIIYESSLNLDSERRSGEMIFRNYRRLLQFLFYGMKNPDEKRVVNQQEVMFNRLDKFHKNLDDVFEEMVTTFESQINHLEATMPDAEQDWVYRLRAHADQLREAYKSIPPTQQFLFPEHAVHEPRFPEFNQAEQPEYVYLQNLPLPLLPQSYLVTPAYPVSMSYSSERFSTAPTRSEISITSDAYLYPKLESNKEMSSTASPSVSGFSSFMSSHVSGSYSSVLPSDSNYTVGTNVSSITPNVSTSVSQVSMLSNPAQATSSTSSMFGQPNPFGPNRIDPQAAGNYSAQMYNRPPPQIGGNSPMSGSASTGRSNQPLNVPPPTSIQPSALVQAAKIPSLLDIHVAPPTSIFKRAAPSDSNVSVSKKSRSDEDESPEVESDPEG